MSQIDKLFISSQLAGELVLNMEIGWAHFTSFLPYQINSRVYSFQEREIFFFFFFWWIMNLLAIVFLPTFLRECEKIM